LEDIIDPARPIVDPHHHLWPGTEYYQDGPYLLPDIRADVESGHDIRATVHVEAHAHYDPSGPEEMRPVGETRFIDSVGEHVQQLGLHTKICAGLVAFADLRHERVADVLDAHRAAAPSRLKGIRQMAAWHPGDEESWATQPKLYMEPDFRRGFALLAPRGLSFDTVTRHFQLPQVADLARSFPDTTIVMGHLGGISGVGPHEGRRAVAIEEWKAVLPEVAACPNIVVKLGGSGMWISGIEWRERPASSDDIVANYADTFHHVIDLFGPSRCMFESNFPVDRYASSYATLWNAFKRIAARYSADEQAWMLHDVANTTYRLGLPPSAS
jgi:L-fuconolactonase